MDLRDYSLGDLIKANAASRPGDECLVMGPERLNFSEYQQRCEGLAAGLAQAGVQPGDRLAVLALNCIETMLLLGAAARLGASLAPINWRLSPAELAHVIQDITPKLVFGGKDYLQPLAEVCDQVPEVTGRYALSGQAKGFVPFADLEGNGQPDIDPPSSDAGCLIIHTAAVDGQMRGALLSQANLLAMSFTAIERFGSSPSQERHLCTLPLYHSQALMMSMVTMLQGGCTVLMERFDPSQALRLITEESITLTGAFPPMLDYLAKAAGDMEHDLSTLRYVAGINNLDTAKAFSAVAPHVVIGTLYGQTESMNLALGSLDENPDSAGRPTMTTRLRIVDDSGNDVPSGQVGEICARTPSVFLGYWGLADETAYVWRDGWHHTGDLGRLDEQGYLHFSGRKADKELIKTGGENVYPAEVERALLEHKAVAEACVIGVPDPQWGEAIVAVCVLAADEEADETELIEFAAVRLAGFKKPRRIIFEDSLPRAGDDSIDRAAIKKQHHAIY